MGSSSSFGYSGWRVAVEVGQKAPPGTNICIDSSQIISVNGIPVARAIVVKNQYYLIYETGTDNLQRCVIWGAYGGELPFNPKNIRKNRSYIGWADVVRVIGVSAINQPILQIVPLIQPG